MSIVVNGKTVAYVEDETISKLLKRMRYTFPLIVIKVNDKLIKKDEYDTFIIPNNAIIQVIHMISGG